MEHGSLSSSLAVQVATGEHHSCALLDTGDVYCWGQNSRGELGYGHGENVGDDEAPGGEGPVPLGGKAVQITAGLAHNCALMRGGAVRCWGHNAFGQLGYGHTKNIGDDEPASAGGDVELPEPVEYVSAGGVHTCVLLAGGRVRCWGDATAGALGYGNRTDIGDDETPVGLADIVVGGTVTQIVTGHVHTCALLATGNIRCWGRGRRPVEDAVGGHGQLGYGHTEDIGDDELPQEAGDVPVGAQVERLAAGNVHTCAIIAGGGVKCWGRGEGIRAYGQLGYPTKENIGDNETPDTVGTVDTGGIATDIVAGDVHTCAIVDNGLRCWGFGEFGQLGYGNFSHIGDDESPASAGDIQLGEQIKHVSVGVWHTCVVLGTGRVRCWGLGVSGQLGYCSTENLGGTQTPATIGDIPL